MSRSATWEFIVLRGIKEVGSETSVSLLILLKLVGEKEGSTEIIMVGATLSYVWGYRRCQRYEYT